MGAEKSDYAFRDWAEIEFFPDFIPIVGAITFAERERQARRVSLREFYLADFKDVGSWISLGTSDWPEPTSRQAIIRSALLASRNVLFAIYHTVLPAAITIRLLEK